jgi:hypothetical protein
MLMELTHEDRDRIWKALACYIEECAAIAEQPETEDSDHFRSEIEETRKLRARMSVRS